MLLVALSLATAGLSSVAIARQGTPPPDEELDLPEGVTLEFIATGEAAELPPGPADIQLFRVGLDPGAAFPLGPDDSSTSLLTIEAGSVTFQTGVPLTVLRATGHVEAIPADEAFTLEAGDSVLVPAGVAGEGRNDGAEPASLLVASVFPLDEGEAMPATPAQS